MQRYESSANKKSRGDKKSGEYYARGPSSASRVGKPKQEWVGIRSSSLASKTNYKEWAPLSSGTQPLNYLNFKEQQQLKQ